MNYYECIHITFLFIIRASYADNVVEPIMEIKRVAQSKENIKSAKFLG